MPPPQETRDNTRPVYKTKTEDPKVKTTDRRPPPPLPPNRARFIRFIRFISGVFCPFQFFIVPIYRAITKNISESTCGKSSRYVEAEFDANLKIRASF